MSLNESKNLASKSRRLRDPCLANTLPCTSHVADYKVVGFREMLLLLLSSMYAPVMRANGLIVVSSPVELSSTGNILC